MTLSLKEMLRVAQMLKRVNYQQSKIDGEK